MDQYDMSEEAYERMVEDARGREEREREAMLEAVPVFASFQVTDGVVVAL